MKHILNTINIFCSISKSRLNEINHLLIPSLLKQLSDYRIALTFINYKADNTVKKDDIDNNGLEVNILNPSSPLGFGESHNYAFRKIKPKDFFLIINPDVYMEKRCLNELICSFSNDVGLVEARQLPFTHPKDLPHKKTFETNWASGCCLLISTKFFRQINGFDPNFWMYLEDVDLSWQAWINGYKVLQNPKAVVYHYTGVYFKYSNNSYELEHFWSIRNFLYISYKYFGDKGLKESLRLTNNTNLQTNIKKAAIDNFQNFKNKNKIQRIEVPSESRKIIKIHDFNKFSEFPE